MSFVCDIFIHILSSKAMNYIRNYSRFRIKCIYIYTARERCTLKSLRIDCVWSYRDSRILISARLMKNLRCSKCQRTRFSVCIKKLFCYCKTTAEFTCNRAASKRCKHEARKPFYVFHQLQFKFRRHRHEVYSDRIPNFTSSAKKSSESIR